MFKVNVFGKAVAAFFQNLEMEKAVILEPTTNWFYRGDKTQIKTVVWGRLISAKDAHWVITNYPNASFVDGLSVVKGHLTLDVLFVNCRPTNVVGCCNMKPDVYKRAKDCADLSSKPDETLGFDFLKELQDSLNENSDQNSSEEDEDVSDTNGATGAESNIEMMITDDGAYFQHNYDPNCSSFEYLIMGDKVSKETFLSVAREFVYSEEYKRILGLFFPDTFFESITEERFLNLKLGETQPSFEYSLGSEESRITDTVFKIESIIVDKEAFNRTIEKLSFTSKQAAILSLVTGLDLDQLGGFWKVIK